MSETEQPDSSPPGDWTLVGEEAWTTFDTGRWGIGFIDHEDCPDDDATISADHVFIEDETCVLEVEPTTAILGIGTVVVLLVGERVAPQLPSALIIVALSIVLVNATGIERRGVAVVGSIHSGVPAITVPTASLSVASQLLPVALALFVLSYVEGMAAVETFAQRHKDRVDANQELLATGVANVAAGLAEGFVVGEGMSRSALNDAVGGHSQAVTAVVALLYGVFIGVLIAVIVVLGRVMYPHSVELGQTVAGDEFTDIARHPSNERVPGVLVYRVDAELFFANAPTVRQDVLERIEARSDPVQLVAFDMRTSPTSDLAAAEIFADLYDRLAHRGIDL